MKTDQPDSRSEDPGGQGRPLRELRLAFRVSRQLAITRHLEKAFSVQETRTEKTEEIEALQGVGKGNLRKRKQSNISVVSSELRGGKLHLLHESWVP